MNVFEMKTPKEVARYPAGYLDNLLQKYHENTQILENLASAPPPAQEECEKVEAMESFLLQRQNQLLEIGANMKAGTLHDITNILKLWHAAAIKDTAPKDVSQTDELMLVVYDYFQTRG